MIGRVSVIDSVAVFASVIIIGAAWRYASLRLHDRAIGQAMAFVY